MITKKEWDALPLSTKKQILAIVYGEDYERFPPKQLLYEYRHNFDFDDNGKRLKKLLKLLYKSDNGAINVRVDVPVSKTERAFFLASPQPAKKVVHQAPVNHISQVQRRHWQVDYTDKEGDLCHVHCYADSKEEARDYVRSEYWDIAEIIQIIPLRD